MPDPRTRPPVSLRNCLIALLLATMLFGSTFLVAHIVSYYNYREIQTSTNIMQNYLSELSNAQQSLSCTSSAIAFSSEYLSQAGTRISLLETRFGKHDRRVLEQKEIYSMLEYEHFLLVRRLNQQCNGTYVTALFIYSNDEDDESESERMGFILSTLKNEYPAQLMVYSFDYYLESELITRLRDEYNVTRAPVVIIDERHTVRPRNVDDMKPYVRHL